MIFVTGDTHGTKDYLKLHAEFWPEGQTLTRDDYLIVCGDFGGVWDGGDRDRTILSWYESQPWTTLWVDGNHENHDIIDELPVTERFGGRVQVAPGYPHVIHLMRGEVYDLPLSKRETVSAFVMGGAQSTDRVWRVEGESWWEREMPDDQEYDNATANLDACDWSVDYVFTHDIPWNMTVDALEWDYFIEQGDPEKNELSGFLQYVDERLDKDRLEMWYAGHYHIDALVGDDQHCVLYQEVVELGGSPMGF